MTGKKLTEAEGEAFGLKVMEKLNEFTAKWKAAEDIDYSLYGTPLESTTYKFAKSRSVSASSRVLQIATTLQTLITFM